MGSDNHLCLPIMEGEKIKILPYEAAYMAGIKEKDDFPKLVLDLEQIQVLDYTKLPLITEEQVTYIEEKLRHSPLVPEELSFLALRSLYSLAWEEITTQEKLLSALNLESALCFVLKKYSVDIAADLLYQDSLLPYWVRLSYLRIMSKIPETVINKSNLKNVTCFPVKRFSFNAYSTMLTTSSIIGFNYALEPILKILNRFFTHFYSSLHIAGPRRLERSWNEIAPIVRYFSIGAKAEELAPLSLIFSMEDAEQVHRMTADQVDFIMTHEMGHIFHGHPRLLADLKGQEDEFVQRHELEYEADRFAEKVFRNWYLDTPDDDKGEQKSKLNEYASFIESTQLLFVYMDFVEQSKVILNDRLKDKFPLQRNNTHPMPVDRLKRIMELSMIELKSEKVEYANNLFGDILDYIKKLELKNLETSIFPSKN